MLENPSKDTLIQRINKEKEQISFDMLGKSLAYNPYMPRFKERFFSRSNLFINKKDQIPAMCDLLAYLKEGFSFEDLAQLQEIKSDIIALDMKRDNLGNPKGEGLECISYLRHYTTNLILLKDIFIDSYQILQAAVFGADGVIMDKESSIKNNMDLALKLGLAVFVSASNPKDITRGILARSDGFFIPAIRTATNYNNDKVLESKALLKNIENLLHLIPSKKIACIEVPSDIVYETNLILPKTAFYLQTSV